MLLDSLTCPHLLILLLKFYDCVIILSVILGDLKLRAAEIILFHWFTVWPWASLLTYLDFCILWSVTWGNYFTKQSPGFLPVLKFISATDETILDGSDSHIWTSYSCNRKWGSHSLWVFSLIPLTPRRNLPFPSPRRPPLPPSLAACAALTLRQLPVLWQPWPCAHLDQAPEYKCRAAQF